MKKIVCLSMILVFILSLMNSQVMYAQPGTHYYVAVNGNDQNSGTIDQPFATITKAMSVAAAGDTVYVRGGVYTEKANIDDKIGTQENPITLSAYPNERPIISGEGFIRLRRCQYVIVRGFELTARKSDLTEADDSSNWCKLGITWGSHNILENNYVHNTNTYNIKVMESTHNIVRKNKSKYGTIGIFVSGMSNPTRYNIIEENDCSYNYRWAGDSDGIQLVSVSSDNHCQYNIVRKNIMYNNADDGLDLFCSNYTLIYGNIAARNGYNPDGNTSSGDGAGFKLGGGKYGIKGGFNLITSSIAYANKYSGIDNNGAPNPVYAFNCVSYKNKWAGFASYTLDYRYGSQQDSYEMFMKNCISYKNQYNVWSDANNNKVIQQNNFIDGNPKMVSPGKEPRNFRLTNESPCINAGTPLDTSMIHANFLLSSLEQVWLDAVNEALTKDFSGVAWEQGGPFNIGAFENYVNEESNPQDEAEPSGAITKWTADFEAFKAFENNSTVEEDYSGINWGLPSNWVTYKEAENTMVSFNSQLTTAQAVFQIPAERIVKKISLKLVSGTSASVQISSDSNDNTPITVELTNNNKTSISLNWSKPSRNIYLNISVVGGLVKDVAFDDIEYEVASIIPDQQENNKIITADFESYSNKGEIPIENGYKNIEWGNWISYKDGNNTVIYYNSQLKEISGSIKLPENAILKEMKVRLYSGNNASLKIESDNPQNLKLEYNLNDNNIHTLQLNWNKPTRVVTISIKTPAGNAWDILFDDIKYEDITVYPTVVSFENWPSQSITNIVGNFSGINWGSPSKWEIYKTGGNTVAYYNIENSKNHDFQFSFIKDSVLNELKIKLDTGNNAKVTISSDNTKNLPVTINLSDKQYHTLKTNWNKSSKVIYIKVEGASANVWDVLFDDITFTEQAPDQENNSNENNSGNKQDTSDTQQQNTASNSYDNNKKIENAVTETINNIINANNYNDKPIIPLFNKMINTLYENCEVIINGAKQDKLMFTKVDESVMYQIQTNLEILEKSINNATGLSDATKAFILKEKKIKLNFGEDSSVEKSKIQLSSKLIEKLEEKSIKNIELNLPFTSIEVPVQSLKNAKDSAFLEFNISKHDAKEFVIESSEQKKLIDENSVIYSFEIKTDDSLIKNAIKEFGFNEKNIKRKAKLKLKYNLKQGENPDRITVFYLNDNGKIQNIGAKYESERKEVIFETTHFSKFLIKNNTFYFKDVNETDANYKSISSLASKGFINGKKEGYFKPNDAIKRNELAKILSVMFKIESNNSENVFSDLKYDDWSSYYVNSVAKAGIFKGFQNNMFRPGDYVTRQQFAVIVSRILLTNEPLNYSKNMGIKDWDNVMEYAKGAVETVLSGQIMDLNDGYFYPNKEVTRGEAMEILYKLYNK